MSNDVEIVKVVLCVLTTAVILSLVVLVLLLSGCCGNDRCSIEPGRPTEDFPSPSPDHTQNTKRRGTA